jgi:hypothetical protein
LRRTSAGEVSQAVMEGSLNDKFKLVWATARRHKEFFGSMPQEGPAGKTHPREAGPPTTINILPQMTGNFLEVVDIDVEAKNGSGKKEVKKITVDQKVFGAKDKNGNRIIRVDEQTGKKYSSVRIAKNSSRVRSDDYWEYEVTGLHDKEIWDSIQFVVENRDYSGEVVDVDLYSRNTINRIEPKPEKTLDTVKKRKLQSEKVKLAMGTNMNAQEVPEGLLDFYALGIFNEFTRTDALDQYDEYANKDKDYKKLKSLSKRFEVGTKNLARQHQLSKDTTEALEEFLRISLVAGVCSAIIAYQIENKSNKHKEAAVTDKVEHQTTVDDVTAYTYDFVVEMMRRAMFKSRFVRTSSDSSGNLRFANTKDSVLFNHIITKRNAGPFDPWKIQEAIEYFEPTQLEELKPLYSVLFPNQ